jgi:hypothetical protein
MKALLPVAAAQNGVRAHHWNFDSMPASGVSDDDVATVTAFVREVQRGNGIQ